jgi:hypothetical protein
MTAGRTPPPTRATLAGRAYLDLRAIAKKPLHIPVQSGQSRRAVWLNMDLIRFASLMVGSLLLQAIWGQFSHGVDTPWKVYGRLGDLAPCPKWLWLRERSCRKLL